MNSNLRFSYLARRQPCTKLSVVFCAVGQFTTTSLTLSTTCKTHSIHLTTNSELRTTLSLHRERITHASSITVYRNLYGTVTMMWCIYFVYKTVSANSGTSSMYVNKFLLINKLIKPVKRSFIVR